MRPAGCVDINQRAGVRRSALPRKGGEGALSRLIEFIVSRLVERTIRIVVINIKVEVNAKAAPEDWTSS